MRADAIFIGVEVDDSVAADAALPPSSPRSARWTSSPSATAARSIVEENLDECVLCRLCLDAAPDGAVKVIKLYDGDAVL